MYFRIDGLLFIAKSCKIPIADLKVKLNQRETK